MTKLARKRCQLSSTGQQVAPLERLVKSFTSATTIAYNLEVKIMFDLFTEKSYSKPFLFISIFLQIRSSLMSINPAQTDGSALLR